MRIFLGLFLGMSLFWGAFAQAAEEFIISDIRVDGLERISPGTVFNALPVKVGDRYDDSRSSDAVSALFKTGYFDDVRLERDGDILVFVIRERPSIGSITVKGNKDIKTEDMLENLKQVGFAEGEVFRKAMLEQISRELRQQYFSHGKYGARVESDTTPMDKNRVAVEIEISEGIAARIKQVNIVGNESFEEDELLELFELQSENWWSFFSKDDQYSKQKLSADVEALRSFYLDQGYLNFSVVSSQISITPDKKDIYITINLSEGDQYTITEIELAGEMIVPEQELRPLILVEEGDLFSRKKLTDTSKILSNALGDKGYAFANINPVPDVNDEERTVSLTFFFDPGKRVYVRRINFLGNESTRDEVLRREMRQQESAWASTAKIERGKLRLYRTGFVKNVNVEIANVPATNDQVDVNYSIEEQASGSINFGLGYSQEQNVLLRTSITQRNFLGSGKLISLGLNTSKTNTQVQLGYANPYYTVHGISRGFNLFFRETDSKSLSISRYNSTEIGGNINYGIPVSEYNTVYLSLEYGRTKISSTSASSTEINKFIKTHGREFDEFNLSSSFRYDTRNKAILPDDGALAQIRAEMAMPFIGHSLEYYKLDFRGQWLQNFHENYILSLKSEVGYGDGYGDFDNLPFFKNFYAGGPNSVRGFRASSLGPKDGFGRSLGGQIKFVNNAEVYLPIPFLKGFQDSARVVAFLDSGNVYDSNDFKLSEMRYSTGLGGLWISPFGQISVSIAKPFGTKPGDSTQQFQFNLGSGF
ncbi:MAG: outer membrane protein assembly factor BamA [Candidatus Eutrophobiaceae bacterium]